MWQNVLNWMLNFLKSIPDWTSWLFEPVNINILSSSLSDFQRQLNESGLSNIPTWLYDIIGNSSNPIYVTPIDVISVSTLTLLLAVFFVKIIIK